MDTPRAGLERDPKRLDVACVALAQYGSAGLGLVTTVLAARDFGPDGYGMAVLAMALPDMLWTFLSVKPLQLVARELAVSVSTRSKAEVASLCRDSVRLDLLSSVGVVLLTGIMCLIARVAGADSKRVLSLGFLYSVSIPFLALAGTSQAVFTVFARFGYLSACQLAERGLALVAVLIMVVVSPTPPGLIIALASAAGLAGLMQGTLALYLLTQYGVRAAQILAGNARSARFRSIRRELGWNYVLVTTGGLIDQAPVMLVGYLRGPAEAGTYRLAANIATVAGYPESALGRVHYPRLVHAWTEKQDLISLVGTWTLRFGLPIALTVAAGVTLLGPAVPVVLGREYARVAPIARVLVAGVAMSTPLFWVSGYYYVSSRLPSLTLMNAAYGLAVLVVGFLVVESAGAFGVAVAVAGGRAVYFTALALSASWVSASRRRRALAQNRKGSL